MARRATSTQTLPRQIKQAERKRYLAHIPLSHILEMYRRQLGDEKTRRKLQRLDKRLLAVASQLNQIDTDEK